MSELRRVVLTQIGYSAWATRQLLQACLGLGPDQLACGLGASHSSILGTFRHIYDGECAWFDRLMEAGDWRLPPEPSPEHSFDFLVGSWPKLWEGYRYWAESATDADLSHEFLTLLPNGTSLRGLRWQIVLHVVNHSTLHRGQILSMLRALRLQPPNVDLMSYYLTV